MGTINNVVLSGRLGHDAAKRVTKKGQAMVHFTMATERRWIDAEGNRHQQAEWHNFTCWGTTKPKSLDNLLPHLVKGKQVGVIGELRTRTWEHEGRRHYRTEVHTTRVELMSGTPKTAGESQSGSATPEPTDADSVGERADDKAPTPA